MTHYQPGILLPIPSQGRYLSFGIQSTEALHHCLTELAPMCDGKQLVVGIGQTLLSALNVEIPGMRIFPALANKGIDVPSTPTALWCWLRGNDRGELYYLANQVENVLDPGLRLDSVIDGFRYKESLDLSGFEDGTENPKGEDATAAALVSDIGPGLDGSSFVAVQQWLHDLEFFHALSSREQDDMIGRHMSDNEEFEDAPDSAHVKRAAQESFDPAAFILRRSMPWIDQTEAGLVFTAFGKSLDAYEMILRRMVGLEDGITDALFEFSRPITGAYYWCPPMQADRLDLSKLDL